MHLGRVNELSHYFYFLSSVKQYTLVKYFINDSNKISCDPHGMTQTWGMAAVRN